MRKIIQLLLLFIALFAGNYLMAQQKYALVVGINKYYQKPGVLYPKVLQGCVNDALAIQSVLKQKFGFSQENIISLLDDKATRPNVLAGFETILSKIKSGDAFVFFFSGHGVWMSNNDQSPLDQSIKDKMNQAMVMSDLYAKNLDCLFTDGLLKKTINRFIDKRAIVTSIFDCCFSGKLPATFMLGQQNPYTWYQMPAEEKSFSFIDVYDVFSEDCRTHPDSCDLLHLNDTLSQRFLDEESTRSFNLTDNLVVNNSEHVVRPAERPRSMFASLAATDDRQKGLEIKDETGTPHGAFTRALLYALQKTGYNSSLKQVIEVVNDAMQKQLYLQTPMYMNDPLRLAKNFIGIAPNNFKDNRTAIWDDIINNSININAGTNDGIAPGNRLSVTKQGSKIEIEITSATINSCVAKMVSGKISQLKKGDVLSVTSSYIRSAPLIKIFIENSTTGSAAFQQLLNKKVIPLSRLTNYWDYENWYADNSISVLYNRAAGKADEIAASLLSQQNKGNFLVYLPIPANITAALKKAFSKNQNFQLVEDEKDANFTLVLNYTKAKPGFVFTWVKPSADFSNIDKFYQHNLKLKTLPTTDVQIKKLVTDILNLTAKTARIKSSQWLNEYPAK